MSGCGSWSTGIGWQDSILPGVEDPSNCMDPRDLGQSEWDKTFQRKECVLSLYDKMRWKWDEVYVLGGLLNTYSPSLCSPPLPVYLCTHPPRSSKMSLEVILECAWRCICWPRSSELRDALGCPDPQDWGYTWTQRSSEAIFDRGGRYNFKLWLNNIRRVLGGSWSASDWSKGGQCGGSQSGGSESGGDRTGGRCDGSWESIHWLTHNCGVVENWVQQGLPRGERLAGSGRQAILERYSKKCMQYAV